MSYVCPRLAPTATPTQAARELEKQAAADGSAERERKRLEEQRQREARTAAAKAPRPNKAAASQARASAFAERPRSSSAFGRLLGFSARAESGEGGAAAEAALGDWRFGALIFHSRVLDAVYAAHPRRPTPTALPSSPPPPAPRPAPPPPTLHHRLHHRLHHPSTTAFSAPSHPPLRALSRYAVLAGAGRWLLSSPACPEPSTPCEPACPRATKGAGRRCSGRLSRMLFNTSWGGLLLLLLSCAGICGYVCVKALLAVLDPEEAAAARSAVDLAAPLTADEMYSARREQRRARQRVEAGLQPCLTTAPRRPPWTIKQARGAPTHR